MAVQSSGDIDHETKNLCESTLKESETWAGLLCIIGMYESSVQSAVKAISWCTCTMIICLYNRVIISNVETFTNHLQGGIDITMVTISIVWKHRTLTGSVWLRMHIQDFQRAH
jgi:hypothetical protein